ncbi:unnamed protein product, partial [Mesorhabditis belari]|uniref:Protein orai n=1 Tax=Mesorhabditis belari TaxID=2138241 RepID=A0AAF3E8A9_9BILA
MSSVHGSEPTPKLGAPLMALSQHASVSYDDRLDRLPDESCEEHEAKASSPLMPKRSRVPDRPGTSSVTGAPLSQSVRWVSALSLLPSSNLHNHPKELQRSLSTRHRGELTMAEKYTYDLSKAQLKASSRTSALLAGFAMVALVELQYEDDTPRALLIILGVVTTLLVSVHLLALMMSTCILPYMEAAGATKDSPHIRLKFYVELSWLFSTCVGLLLFLVEIGVIFFVKFVNVGYNLAAYITTAMLIPVLIIFVVFSYLIHKSRTTHSLERIKDKVAGLNEFFDAEKNLPSHGNIQNI